MKAFSLLIVVAVALASAESQACNPQAFSGLCGVQQQQVPFYGVQQLAFPQQAYGFAQPQVQFVQQAPPQVIVLNNNQRRNRGFLNINIGRRGRR